MFVYVTFIMKSYRKYKKYKISHSRYIKNYKLNIKAWQFTKQPGVEDLQIVFM